MMKDRHHAQSLVELAVFGSVLLFLIGSMASTHLSGSFQQNAQFYAMRQSLLNSYLTSKKGDSSRVSASYTVFEDRLGGDFGKFGTLDRQPVAGSGGGMMTYLAMRPNDWPDEGGFYRSEGLSVMDVVINGKPFVFRSNAWVRYFIFLRSYPGSQESIDSETVPDPNNVQIIKIRPANYTDLLGPLQWQCSNGLPCVEGEICVSPMTWPCPSCECDCEDWGGHCSYNTCDIDEEVCASTQLLIAEETLINSAISTCLDDRNAQPGGLVISCNAGTPLERQRLFIEWSHGINAAAGGYTTGAMPYFYSVVASNSKDPVFGAPLGNWYERMISWDYNRNGVFTDDLPDEGDYSKTTSSWRWQLAEAPYVGKDLISKDDQTYPPFDINGDLVEETLYAFADKTSELCTIAGRCHCTYSSANPDACKGAAFQVNVLDPNSGDLNMMRSAKDFTDKNQVPGMRTEMKIRGRTTCENTANLPGGDNCADEDRMTYLEIKEGKAYSVNGNPLSISQVKKNQYDMIERIYQLNIDMADIAGFERLNSGSIETSCTGSTSTKAEDSCCMTLAPESNIEKTCLDKTTKTLYIRSRFIDKRGHKWMTDMTRDWKQSLGE